MYRINKDLLLCGHLTKSVHNQLPLYTISCLYTPSVVKYLVFTYKEDHEGDE
uniref:Uncharacterized protein n=1 Tax=Arion vulgaris TaxID=1028688 RepID=A0A0B6Y1W9_9EUPU